MTALRVVNAFACKCERCPGEPHEWTAVELPERCPKCRSPYWNVKRGELPRGRPPKRKPRKAGR